LGEYSATLLTDLFWDRMGRTRQILAVTLVATALCADRAVAAAVAPEAPVRPQSSVVEMAGRFVSRLSSNFRRVVATVRIYEPRSQQTAPSFDRPIPDSAPVAQLPISPNEFRLPPPTA
jgi:hypothetical protein